MVGFASSFGEVFNLIIFHRNLAAEKYDFAIFLF